MGVCARAQSDKNYYHLEVFAARLTRINHALYLLLGDSSNTCTDQESNELVIWETGTEIVATDNKKAKAALFSGCHNIGTHRLEARN